MADDRQRWLATLPSPYDDSTASGLLGRELPDIALVDVTGASLSLRALGTRLVMFVYPATGVPGRDAATDPAPGWDSIPGAPGCTLHSLGYRDRYDEFVARGFCVAGVSAQPRNEQSEFVERNHIPFPMLNDSSFMLAQSLGLPTFMVAGQRFYKRLALVAIDGQVVHVTYPAIPPDRNAGDVLGWLERHLEGELREPR